MQLDPISKSLFKERALEFLDQVESTGKSVVITENGRPTIEVRRFRIDQRTPLQRLKGKVTTYTLPAEPVGDTDWEAIR